MPSMKFELRNGLIEVDGDTVRACDILWPEAVA